MRVCRLCDGGLELVLKLRDSPLANAYTRERVEQRLYPLTLMQCGDCGHVQLKEVVEPAVLYSDYRYRSGASRGFRAHLDEYARRVSDERPGARVLEIASNDGTFLKALQWNGHEVWGVDPAGDYRCDCVFFDGDYEPPFVPDVIVANNVLAHVDDVRGFLDAVRKLLPEDGLFVFEVQYLGSLVRQNRFDLIYHEHLSYFGLPPLERVLTECGLYPFHVEHNQSQGGSLRVWCSKKRDTDHRGWVAVNEYDVRHLHVPENPVRHLTGSIAAYGACAKTTGLIVQTGARFDFIMDDNPAKIGMFAPTGHEIVAPGTRDADHVYLAAWNFADEIREKHPEMRLCA